MGDTATSSSRPTEDVKYHGGQNELDSSPGQVSQYPKRRLSSLLIKRPRCRVEIASPVIPCGVMEVFQDLPLLLEDAFFLPADFKVSFLLFLLAASLCPLLDAESESEESSLTCRCLLDLEALELKSN